MNELNTFEAGIRATLEEFIPPPFQEDLRKIGIWSNENTGAISIGPGKIGGDLSKEKIKISSDIHPAQARIMSHVIEKKLIPGLYGRSDYIRSAVFFYTMNLVKHIRDKSFVTAYYRMEMERQIYAARMEQMHADQDADLIRKSAQLACRDGNVFGARETLRNARHFMDCLTSSIQERFSNRIYGSADGKARPENWEGDEVARLWKVVCEEDRGEVEGVEVG